MQVLYTVFTIVDGGGELLHGHWRHADCRSCDNEVAIASRNQTNRWRTTRKIGARSTLQAALYNSFPMCVCLRLKIRFLRSFPGLMLAAILASSKSCRGWTATDRGRVVDGGRCCDTSATRRVADWNSSSIDRMCTERMAVSTTHIFYFIYLMKSTKDHMGHWYVNKNRLNEYEYYWRSAITGTWPSVFEGVNF
jgi:hypothetical protein